MFMAGLNGLYRAFANRFLILVCNTPWLLPYSPDSIGKARNLVRFVCDHWPYSQAAHFPYTHRMFYDYARAKRDSYEKAMISIVPSHSLQKLTWQAAQFKEQYSLGWN
jgi:hypothetical protein